MVVVAPIQFCDVQVATDEDLLAPDHGVARRQVAQDDEAAGAIGFQTPDMLFNDDVSSDQDEPRMGSAIVAFPPRRKRVVQIQAVEVKITFDIENKVLFRLDLV
ncbi:hypothetical protein D3C78_1178090 [compost metagenome]